MSHGTRQDTSLEQRRRFEQAARELGVDLDEGKLREALRNVAKRRPPPRGDGKEIEGK